MRLTILALFIVGALGGETIGRGRVGNQVCSSAADCVLRCEDNANVIADCIDGVCRCIDVPTDAPTDVPTDAATDAPTDAPTDAATEAPVADESSLEYFDKVVTLSLDDADAACAALNPAAKAATMQQLARADISGLPDYTEFAGTIVIPGVGLPDKAARCLLPKSRPAAVGGVRFPTAVGGIRSPIRTAPVRTYSTSAYSTAARLPTPGIRYGGVGVTGQSVGLGVYGGAPGLSTIGRGAVLRRQGPTTARQSLGAVSSSFAPGLTYGGRGRVTYGGPGRVTYGGPRIGGLPIRTGPIGSIGSIGSIRDIGITRAPVASEGPNAGWPTTIGEWTIVDAAPNTGCKSAIPKAAVCVIQN